MTEPSTKPRRGLPRCRSRYSLLPMADGKRLPISIPTVAKQSWDPMQRWRESPPESEAASIAAIFDAVQTTDIPRVQYPGRGAVPSSRVGSWTQDSVSSVSSSRSSRSNTSRRLAQRPSVGQRIRARANHRASNESLRIFCCTFCCDTFRTKHDWTRHEKSLHLNCDQWACTPYGGIVVSPVTMRSQCSYCNMLDPTSSHLETHKHGACRNNQQEPFRRKDHLIQHLRGFHQLDTLPPVEDWRIQGPVITSRCGFCDERLESWEARANHLADHFRQGKTMANWTGDHGFEPSIASQVRNSLPPYHLAFEASSLVPFSATDPRTTDHLAQLIETHGRPEQPPSQKDLEIPLNDSQLEPEVLTPTLFTPFLVWHLGRFAQQSVAAGVVPTDQMFQDEARRLMYGDDGNWERTVADNSEWMAAFRNQHWPNNHK
ncbi:hypothetical protein EDB81DRAFT_661887 [Dactylonectria macrodidyma]|uniref:C2H2-type domain-containing protein n=1 Tax=Dactylonectria macrodidyma TaxID=307937 RepID=A0A9P9IQI6_9HYPO|nr:hypothetical protein EDB81DRAFT_661887 [Dactylonectria macrodidyma]